MSSPSTTRTTWLLPLLAASIVVAGVLGIVVWKTGGPSGSGGSGSSTVTASETIAAEGSAPSGTVSVATTSGEGVTGSKPSSGGRPAARRSAPAGQLEGDFYLRLAWWNDTEERPPAGFLVTLGDISWTADATKRSQVASIGPLAVGKKLQLLVYPDGRSGARLVVPITVRQGMVSGSEQDGIHVEVKDAGVRVLGNAVENLEQTFERP